MIRFALEPIAAPASLETEWRALEQRGKPSFFTSWHWIGTLLETVPAASRPSLLRGDDGALALLGAHETRRRRVIRSRGAHLNATGDPAFDCTTIEHNGVLAASGGEAAALAGLLAFFGRSGDRFDELHLPGMPAPVPGATSIADVPSFRLDLARLGPDGDPCRVLSTNARQQLRRSMRHFERLGPLEIRFAGSEAEAASFFEGLKRLHIPSWERRGKAHSFTRPYFETFHRALIERAFPATELSQVSAGGRTLGYLYNFRYRDRVYAYQSGFDDADRAERPGVVCHALAIAESFRRGAAVYDFMAGRNRLKESFATEVTPMVWQVVQQQRLVFRLEALARRVKKSLPLGPSEG